MSFVFTEQTKDKHNNVKAELARIKVGGKYIKQEQDKISVLKVLGT